MSLNAAHVVTLSCEIGVDLSNPGKEFLASTFPKVSNYFFKTLLAITFHEMSIVCVHVVLQVLSNNLQMQ